MVHTVPSLETLEKFARGLEMRLYAVLYELEGTTSRRDSVAGLSGAR